MKLKAASSWSNNYIFDQIVKICHENINFISKEMAIFTGVSQCSILKPLLFIIFVNDMTSKIAEFLLLNPEKTTFLGFSLNYKKKTLSNS